MVIRAINRVDGRRGRRLRPAGDVLHRQPPPRHRRLEAQFERRRWYPRADPAEVEPGNLQPPEVSCQPPVAVGFEPDDGTPAGAFSPTQKAKLAPITDPASSGRWTPTATSPRPPTCQIDRSVSSPAAPRGSAPY